MQTKNNTNTEIGHLNKTSHLKFPFLREFHITKTDLYYRNYESTEIIDIFYSALNFRDIMFATGKISFTSIDEPPTAPSTYIGLEFSGLAGVKRVMGINYYGGISLQGKVLKDMMWEIPDHWSLEDAATVPVAFVTVSKTICFLKMFWTYIPGFTNIKKINIAFTICKRNIFNVNDYISSECVLDFDFAIRFEIPNGISISYCKNYHATNELSTLSTSKKLPFSRLAESIIGILAIMFNYVLVC